MALGMVGGKNYNDIGLARIGQSDQSDQGLIASLMAVLSDPNASIDDKKTASALLAGLVPARKSEPTNTTIGDDSEGPEEILQELLTTLLNNPARVVELSQQDINDLRIARATASTALSSQDSPAII